MKRCALVALFGALLCFNTGCQHCCWTIFPDVAACGPGMGCGKTYWGDWRAKPDPCDQCANWVGDGHAAYNKWGRREDGGGCELGCASCGCSSGQVMSDCGCGQSQGEVIYEE